MRLGHRDAWRVFEESASAVLGTVDPDRGSHLVPVVFTTIGDDRIVIPVDGKPKRTRRLRRLANIESDPRVVLLADHYADDWSLLWWVRVDGLAGVVTAVEQEVERRHRDRYSQSAGQLLGPWIDVTVERVSGWSAT